MTVNHDVAGSSPAGGAKKFQVFGLGIFLSKPKAWHIIECITRLWRDIHSYIIKPQESTRWRVMRYNNGSAVVGDIHRTPRGDDMPSLWLG